MLISCAVFQPFTSRKLRLDWWQLQHFWSHQTLNWRYKIYSPDKSGNENERNVFSKDKTSKFTCLHKYSFVAMTRFGWPFYSPFLGSCSDYFMKSVPTIILLLRQYINLIASMVVEPRCFIVTALVLSATTTKRWLHPIRRSYFFHKAKSNPGTIRGDFCIDIGRYVNLWFTVTVHLDSWLNSCLTISWQCTLVEKKCDKMLCDNLILTITSNVELFS